MKRRLWTYFPLYWNAAVDPKLRHSNTEDSVPLLLFFFYLCITFLRRIQGLFNDRIYKVKKIVDQNVEDDSSMFGPIVFWRNE